MRSRKESRGLAIARDAEIVIASEPDDDIGLKSDTFMRECRKGDLRESTRLRHVEDFRRSARRAGEQGLKVARDGRVSLTQNDKKATLSPSNRTRHVPDGFVRIGSGPRQPYRLIRRCRKLKPGVTRYPAQGWNAEAAFSSDTRPRGSVQIRRVSPSRAISTTAVTIRVARPRPFMVSQSATPPDRHGSDREDIDLAPS
jgi:hypothetical protein